MLQFLLVENDIEVAEVLKAGIESSGDAAVTCAGSGSAANDVLGTEQFDIALIETLLPDISGFELARRAASGNVPVLLMSGHPAQQDLCRVHRFPFLEKPFPPSALLALVDETLRQTQHNIFRVQQSCYRLDMTVARSKLLALEAAWLRKDGAALRAESVALKDRHKAALVAMAPGTKGTSATELDVADRMVYILFRTTTALIRRNSADLTARQTAAFLICYLDAETQTVRSLAAKLKVARAVISRVLDRLSEFDLVRRKADPLDRRSVLVRRTATGRAFLREVKTMLVDADRDFPDESSHFAPLVPTNVPQRPVPFGDAGGYAPVDDLDHVQRTPRLPSKIFGGLARISIEEIGPTDD